MAEFDLWADYYDYLHPGLPGEAEFYVGQALKRGGPVLEIGCGTGRIAIPIALSGVKVTGLDNSSAMLDVCADKAGCVGLGKGALTLVEADMRDFTISRRFPLAIMAYRTLMHCLTPDDQLACLRRIHKHLVPGGELLLNLWAASPATINTFSDVSTACEEKEIAAIAIPEEEVTLIHYMYAWRDDFRQLLHERHRVIECDSYGKTLHEEKLSMTRAWITPREMEHLVARAGFEVVAELGDFDGVLFSPGHTEMIWHLRRPERGR